MNQEKQLSDARVWFDLSVKIGPAVMIGMKQCLDKGMKAEDYIPTYLEMLTSDEVMIALPQHKTIILSAREGMKSKEFIQWVEKRIRGYR